MKVVVAPLVPKNELNFSITLFKFSAISHINAVRLASCIKALILGKVQWSLAGELPAGLKFPSQRGEPIASSFQTASKLKTSSGVTATKEFHENENA